MSKKFPVKYPVFWRWIIVAAITLAFMFWGYSIIKKSLNRNTLPVYGERQANGTDHFISDFSLTDQLGKRFSESDLDGKIYVADFFFVQCTGICPIMNSQLERVYRNYKTENDVQLVSFTVKPEEDSVPVLFQFAKSMDADPAKWHFLTGDRKVIYELARKSYMVEVEGTGEDFVHTQFFALVDKKKRIRGFYDGTDSVKVDNLVEDIENLLKED